MTALETLFESAGDRRGHRYWPVFVLWIHTSRVREVGWLTVCVDEDMATPEWVSGQRVPTHEPPCLPIVVPCSQIFEPVRVVLLPRERELGVSAGVRPHGAEHVVVVRPYHVTLIIGQRHGGAEAVRQVVVRRVAADLSDTSDAVDVAKCLVVQHLRDAQRHVPGKRRRGAIEGPRVAQAVPVVGERGRRAVDGRRREPVGGVPGEAVGASAREVAVVVVAVAHALDGGEAVDGVVGVVVAVLRQPVAGGVVGVGVGLGPGVGDARQAVEVVVAVGVRAEAVDALGAVASAVVGD